MASPFRTQTIECPRCPATELSAGDLRHCAKCKGTWIPQQTLAEHVSAMQADVKPKLVWKPRNDRIGLPCAECRFTMETALLFDVAVDRCHSHGVWFDKDELAEVLHRSAGLVHPKPPEGSAALDVGEAAIETTFIAAEAASTGIFEGVLDVLGGIFSAIDL